MPLIIFRSLCSATVMLKILRCTQKENNHLQIMNIKVCSPVYLKWEPQFWIDRLLIHVSLKILRILNNSWQRKLLYFKKVWCGAHGKDLTKLLDMWKLRIEFSIREWGRRPETPNAKQAWQRVDQRTGEEDAGGSCVGWGARRNPGEDANK